MKPFSISDISYMAMAIHPNDIAGLPAPHRSVAEYVLGCLSDEKLPIEPRLLESSYATKTDLSSKQLCLMAFVHSWRGEDQHRMVLEADYWIRRYIECE